MLLVAVMLFISLVILMVVVKLWGELGVVVGRAGETEEEIMRWNIEGGWKKRKNENLGT